MSQAASVMVGRSYIVKEADLKLIEKDLLADRRNTTVKQML
jgi:hypothetical protein